MPLNTKYMQLVCLLDIYLYKYIALSRVGTSLQMRAMRKEEGLAGWMMVRLSKCSWWDEDFNKIVWFRPLAAWRYIFRFICISYHILLLLLLLFFIYLFFYPKISRLIKFSLVLFWRKSSRSPVFPARLYFSFVFFMSALCFSQK